MNERLDYGLVLPPPWTQLPLDDSTRERVQSLVDDIAAQHTPKHVPPDQVAVRKRQVVEAMMQQVEQARSRGGVDLYLPLDSVHGFEVQASFVVSHLRPDVRGDSDGSVSDVMARLLADEGATAEVVGGETWVRRAGRHAESPDEPVPSSRVEYVAPLPGGHGWVMVAFSSAGAPLVDPDGDPDADLLVALFDAIMSTWRWVRTDDAVPSSPVPSPSAPSIGAVLS